MLPNCYTKENKTFISFRNYTRMYLQRETYSPSNKSASTNSHSFSIKYFGHVFDKYVYVCNKSLQCVQME